MRTNGRHTAKQSSPGRGLLDRYSDQLGHLFERQMTMTALEAAKREAERQAINARLAAEKAMRSNEALRTEIERRIETQARLAHLASHDPLTSLPNRTLLIESLEKGIENTRRSGRALALLYLDLDHFKDVNDTLGHAAGDSLLRIVAQRLQNCLRDDAMVARMGGDEFSIWVPNLDAAGASFLARRIVQCMSEPVTVAGHRVFVGVSIGITICPHDGDDATSLLSNGDIAMYRAKQEGRNCVQLFDMALNEEVRRRALLEQALHEAVPLEQVEVAYQPQVEVDTGRIVGVEALLRWTHPTHGPVLPAEFVPIAERCGLINNLGTWVLYEACQQAVRWTNAGLAPIRVAVNLATAQFKGSDVPRLVAEVLAATGLEPSRLELEITESGVMQDMRNAAEVLRALAQLGVSLAIDDFGTGYSSLSYLRKLPVDKIKIDRSFVSDATGNEDAAIVATAIVQLAHSLRLSVVAEGVETEAHACFVGKTGCELAQGFFYGRPVAAELLSDRLSRWAPEPLMARLPEPLAALSHWSA